MALSGNAQYIVSGNLGTRSGRVKDAAQVWHHALVGKDNTGHIIPWDSAGTTKFLGLAYIDKLGDANKPAADDEVFYYNEGVTIEDVSVATVAGIADEGKPVYATDDNTFTLVAGGNTRIGHVHRHKNGTNCSVTLMSEDAWSAIAA